jgi:hypothetical protein
MLENRALRYDGGWQYDLRSLGHAAKSIGIDSTVRSLDEKEIARLPKERRRIAHLIKNGGDRLLSIAKYGQHTRVPAD